MSTRVKVQSNKHNSNRAETDAVSAQSTNSSSIRTHDALAQNVVEMDQDFRRKLKDYNYFRQLCEKQECPKTIGNYEVLEMIGSGGMGQVFKARQANLNREVAIKVLEQAKAENHEAITRFNREILALGELDHPNIVTVHDAGEHNGKPYIVMRLVSGLTLKQWVGQHQGDVPIELACKHILDTANALEHAHSNGIVHRDIKPTNIMIDQNGNAQLLDLGLAKFMPSADSVSQEKIERDLTRENRLLGTPHYMAPEQFRSSSSVDHRADIYSLAATLYFLLTGQVVFPTNDTDDWWATATQVLADEAPNLSSIRPDVPIELEQLVMCCLSKKPEDRIKTAGEFAKCLAVCIDRLNHEVSGTTMEFSVRESAKESLGIGGWCRVLENNGRDIEGKLLKAGTQVLCHPDEPKIFMKYKPENWKRFKTQGFT